jgi:hypothetical protein
VDPRTSVDASEKRKIHSSVRNLTTIPCLSNLWHNYCTDCVIIAHLSTKWVGKWLDCRYILNFMVKRKNLICTMGLNLRHPIYPSVD